MLCCDKVQLLADAAGNVLWLGPELKILCAFQTTQPRRRVTTQPTLPQFEQGWSLLGQTALQRLARVVALLLSVARYCQH